MPSGTGRYEGSDGERHYRWWSPGKPEFAVLFGHGFGDHSGRYQRFADTVGGFGGAVFVPDYRGHGLSPGERAVVEDFDVVAADYLAVTGLPEFPSGIPLFLAGQSMRGLVASRAALLDRVDIARLVVSGARIGGWLEGEELVGKIDRGEVDPKTGDWREDRQNPLYYLVKVEKVAPLGDPMEVTIKNYKLSLRKKEAEGIAMEAVR